MGTKRLMQTIAAITLLCLHPALASVGTHGLLPAGEGDLEGCTVGVASGHVTVDGRPIMWKVRDWSGRQGVVHFAAEPNYPIEYVAQCSVDGGVGAGLSAAGVATGNSAVGSGANWPAIHHILGNYTSIDDIQVSWQSAVDADTCGTSGCFPLIDAQGNAVMFESNLSSWLLKYDSLDPNRKAQGLYGFVVRANEFHNHMDGTDDQTIGGRYASGTYNVLGLVDSNNLSVQTLIQGDKGPGAGYEFVRYGPGRELAAISRDNNISTIVVHGVAPGEDPALATMWIILGQSNYGIAVPAWAMVSDIPACLPSGDMYDRATSLWSKRNEASTQASVFPVEAHMFHVVLDTLLPRWRVDGVSVEDMNRVEHQFAADAYSLMDCLDTRQANNNAPQIDFDVFVEGSALLFALTAYDVEGSIATIAWDFGDGHTSAEHSPSHTYAVPGTYLIGCTVTDDDGVSVTDYKYSVDSVSFPPLSVENARTGERYALIGRAVLDAEPGDVILLDPGIYEESIQFGATPLTVSSLDPNDPAVVADTIIRGAAVGPTVTFAGTQSVGSTLNGLTIQNETVGISCRSAAPTIRNCVVESPDGIAVEFWYNRRPELTDSTFLGQVNEGGDPGLIAYWQFDEAEGSIAHDTQGDHDATLIGVPLWQPEGGMIDGALQFDGLTNFAITKVVRDPSEGLLSVFAWVKGGAPGQVILSQRGGFDWLMAASDGCLKTSLKSGGRLDRSLTSEVIITDGAWHRVGFVWDGSNRILYVDDIEIARDTHTGLAGSTGSLLIGAGCDAAPGSFWDGLIDDVRIYDRAVRP
jgi:hypothetical protein